MADIYDDIQALITKHDLEYERLAQQVAQLNTAWHEKVITPAEFLEQKTALIDQIFLSHHAFRRDIAPHFPNLFPRPH